MATNINIYLRDMVQSSILDLTASLISIENGMPLSNKMLADDVQEAFAVLDNLSIALFGQTALSMYEDTRDREDEKC